MRSRSGLSAADTHFNERRHSESVVKSRNSQPGKIDRPKSENHGGKENCRRGSGQDNLNNGGANPFQDDHLPVWEHRNSNLSSPEVGAEPHYSYNYKRVTAAPRTPERSGR